MLLQKAIDLISPARRLNWHIYTLTVAFIIALAVPHVAFSQDVTYGAKNYIKNSYGGSFLDTCANSNCTSTSKYGVVTDTQPDRASVGTGKWIIESAAGKMYGSTVKVGDTVYLKNVYGGGSYLDSCGNSNCTASSTYGVVTDANRDRGGVGTGKWVIESATGKAVGSVLQARDEVFLKNKYSAGSYLDTCGNSNCTATSKYGVCTDDNQDRAGVGTGRWAFQPLLNISGVSFAKLGSTADDPGIGTLKQSDTEGGWIEYGADGEGNEVVRFAFQEVQRDENSVYLHDSSRKVDIRIDMYMDKVMYSDRSDSEPRPLYHILSSFNNAPYNNIVRSVAQDNFSFTCSEPQGMNGCSNPLGDPVSTGIYNPLFKSACNTHDACYRSPWRKAGFSNYSGQNACDQAFLKDMEDICDNADFEVLDFMERLYCKAAAEIYTGAVQLDGSSSFDNGQKEAGRYCAVN